MRHSKFLPLFIPSPSLQPIHIDDLVKGLLLCLKINRPTILSIASPHEISFSTFLKSIVQGRTSRNMACFPIPIPSLLIRFLDKLVGSRLSRKFGFERLISLFALKKMDTTSDLLKLGITLRPLSSGMSRSGLARRELIREGYIVMTYILRTRPSLALMKTYVRAVETFRVNRALSMPSIVSSIPATLALIEGATSIDKDFQNEINWRLNAAVSIAEASTIGAHRFLGPKGRPNQRFKVALALSIASYKEFSRRLLQLILCPMLSRIGKKGVFK